MLATALISFQAHRLRVEFALVAVPMIALLLKDAPLVSGMRRLWPSRAVWGAIGLALVLSLAVAERERVLESQDIPQLYPGQALAFAASHGIAKQPYSTIGFGSFLLWDQYGVRRTFIDGRNFDPALYQDPEALKALLQDQAYVAKEMEQVEREWLVKQAELEQP